MPPTTRARCAASDADELPTPRRGGGEGSSAAAWEEVPEFGGRSGAGHLCAAGGPLLGEVGVAGGVCSALWKGYVQRDGDVCRGRGRPPDRSGGRGKTPPRGSGNR